MPDIFGTLGEGGIATGGGVDIYKGCAGRALALGENWCAKCTYTRRARARVLLRIPVDTWVRGYVELVPNPIEVAGASTR